jgi:hypothetical protein
MFQISSRAATWTARVGTKTFAVLTFLSIVLLPSLSHAEMIYGIFNGVAGVEIDTWDNAQLVGTVSRSEPATFQFSLDTSAQTLSASIGTEVSGYGSTELGAGGFSLGPGFVSGFTYFGIDHTGPDSFSFSVTYQSIGPDGLIDPVHATASADYETGSFPFPPGTNGSGDARLVDFQTVPESSSIVIMALGMAGVALACASKKIRHSVFRSSRG